MKFKLVFPFLILFSPIFSEAQIQFQSKKIELIKGKIYSVQPNHEISALSILIEENQNLENTFIEADGVKYQLSRHDEFSEKPTTQLIVFDKPVKEFSIKSGFLEGALNIRMQYVKPLENSILPLRIANDSCGKPAMISILEWRKGLPAPIEAPISSKVNFVIVHHSAGSNTATNYTEVVRNIYVFHTSPAPNGNGWNDVGYNFLIAQDGTIYEGRDGQGKFEGDNVVGAHFCGKNTNTMGICLLGNYMEIEPSKPALKSLNQLIGWKLSKEGLQNIGQAQHSGGLLNIISGHRDGCSTDCPGNLTYAKLNEIRNSVGQNCAFKNKIVSIESLENQQINIYPNPTSEFLQIDLKEKNNEKLSLKIFDSVGKTYDFESEKSEEKLLKINISGLSEGVYFLSINQKKIKFVVGK